MIIRQVQNKEELRKALTLVHDIYVEQGYMLPKYRRMRVSIHNALPNTCTYIVIHKNKIIATITVFEDSKYGLPCCNIYQKEINNLRSKNRKIVEFGMLASIRKNQLLTVSLLKYAFYRAKYRNADDIVNVKLHNFLAVSLASVSDFNTDFHGKNGP